MCGIAGIIKFNSKVTNEEIKGMSDSMVHRGPDGEGAWINDQENVGLGHRRLAIIDLSLAGKQPMVYLDRYVITYNGELYNFIELKGELEKSGVQFKTESDTEVLLAAYVKYGRACVSKFDGMFAFAIYDRMKKTLFCARDRFGEKPFYYSIQNDYFVFSSEMKALWSFGVSRIPYKPILYNYLLTGNIQTQDKSQTFYKDIFQLQSSHFFTLNEGQRTVNQVQYWSLDLTQNKIVESDALSQFSHLFSTSVKRRLRSDVAVGSSLSGGLDSSVLVKEITELTGKPIKTFSAIFPGFHNNEQRYQKVVSNEVASDHFEVYPSTEKCIENFDKVLYHQEQPFGSASINAQFEVFKLSKSNDITVMLDGQGADEILAGYKNTTSFYLRELLKQGMYYTFVKEGLQSISKQNSSMALTFGKAMAHWLPTNLNAHLNTSSYLNNVEYLNEDFVQEFISHKVHKRPYFNSLNEMLDYQSNNFGLERLLRYCDRNAMANSIEVRLPFLNHDLVEFIFSLPSKFKIRNGWTKWILRETFNLQLPDEIVWRRNKVGYESEDNYFTSLMEDPETISSLQNVKLHNFFKKNSKMLPKIIFWRKFVLSRLLYQGMEIE